MYNNIISVTDTAFVQSGILVVKTDIAPGSRDQVVAGSNPSSLSFPLPLSLRKDNEGEGVLLKVNHVLIGRISY